MEIMEGLPPLLKAFWFIAIPTSVIFIIQAVMTFIGIDSHDGLEADFDSNLQGGHEPFQVFSLRNLINFLLGFSWAGISFYSTISNTILLIIISLVVGCLFVLLFFFIIRQIQKLAEDNSFRIGATINKTAEVYLAIPANRQGKGKVLVSVNGSVHELQAITESERVDSGTLVKVVRVENDSVLIVEKI